jgi:hypothetical protein
MKTVNKEEKVQDFRIWCERCSIRIAPHEEQIEVNGKTYHQRCYSKPGVSQPAKALGDKK